MQYSLDTTKVSLPGFLRRLSLSTITSLSRPPLLDILSRSLSLPCLSTNSPSDWFDGVCFLKRTRHIDTNTLLNNFFPVAGRPIQPTTTQPRSLHYRLPVFRLVIQKITATALCYHLIVSLLHTSDTVAKSE